MSASRRDSEKPRGVGTSWTRQRRGGGRRARGEPRREEADAEAVGRADADDAGGGRLGALQPRLDGEHLGLDALQGLEQRRRRRRSARCRGCGGASSFAPSAASSAAIRAAERRLVDAERARGAEHLAGAGDGEKHAGVVPVERHCE